MTSLLIEPIFSSSATQFEQLSRWQACVWNISQNASFELTKRSARSLDTSYSLRSSERRLFEELLSTFAESSFADWDGEGARPVTARTLSSAISLISLLPKSGPPPVIDAHSDGEVGFEWYVDKDHVLTLSVGPSGMISFAASIGTERLRGREFLRASFPESIAIALARVTEAESNRVGHARTQR